MRVRENTFDSAAQTTLSERRAANVARGVASAHPVWIANASGAAVWDVDGRRYIDFVGGIGTLNAGHANPRVVAAIAEQASHLTHMCFQVAMYEPYLRVAEELNRRAPGASPKKTLLLSTGAEATENAVKIAREYTRRPAVVAFTHGYHGRTLLALSMTGKAAPYKQHFGPFCSEIYHSPFPYEHHGVSARQAIAALGELFDAVVSPDRVAAFIVEPVLGEGGFVPAPPAFLHELRRIADEHGIVLIADEIQTGFGRTGTLFACEQYGIEMIPVSLTGAGPDMDEVERLAVEDRKLETIGVGDDAGDGPAAGRRHLDLALDQRLADLEVRIELAALEHLGLDLAAGGSLDLAEIIPHRDVAQMRGRGIERQPQAKRLVGPRRPDQGRRSNSRKRGEGKMAA